MNWKKIFNKFNDNNILIIGDIMIDSYLIGKVERISPEAPVPVVDIEVKESKLGGAANVALNIKELGATPIICSVVGKDANALELFDLLKKSGLKNKFILKSSSRKTTCKTRIIGNNVQLIRIDDETKFELDFTTYNSLKENIAMAVAENHIDGIIFQDYDKGVISLQLIKYITELSKKRNIPLFVDPKLKNFNFYGKSTIFKPNFNELKRGLNNENLKIEKWNEAIPHIESMINDKNIDTFYTTLGDRGLLISYREDNNFIHKHIQGEKRSVADVSGAGDTVISVASLLTINGIERVEVARIANIAGGLVCEKSGVVPIDADWLLSQI